MKIAAFVVTLVPYHHARWQAFAMESGHEVHLIEIAGKDEFGVLECSPEEAGYTRHVMFPGREHGALTQGEVFRSTYQILGAIRPDVVCVNGYWCGDSWAAMSWCQLNHVPAIVLSETNAFDQKRLPWKEGIKRILVTSCSAGMAGGVPQCAYLADLGLKKEAIFAGYDAVDNAHFARGAAVARDDAPTERARLGLPEKYFFACARFTKKKNLPGLIRAYGAYRQMPSTSAWSLVLAGDGPQRGEIESLIRELGVGEFVQLVGPQGYTTLPTYYGLASAFVHASLIEQWGLVVNEAMAAGLPVVISHRCGCATDLVATGENGLLFAPENIMSIAEALAEISKPSADLAAMGRASSAIVAGWGPSRFASGLSAAVSHALSHNVSKRARLWPWLMKAAFRA